MGFRHFFQYDSTPTIEPAMFESSFLSDVINLYYVAQWPHRSNGWLVRVICDVTVARFLNAYNGLQIILTYRSKQICQIYCECDAGVW